MYFLFCFIIVVIVFFLFRVSVCLFRSCLIFVSLFICQFFFRLSSFFSLVFALSVFFSQSLFFFSFVSLSPIFASVFVCLCLQFLLPLHLYLSHLCFSLRHLRLTVLFSSPVFLLSSEYGFVNLFVLFYFVRSCNSAFVFVLLLFNCFIFCLQSDSCRFSLSLSPF